jgi:serine/threonine protein kinase/tetratricopeptide (TPR) repeat protein
MQIDLARVEEIFGEAVTKADAAARNAYLEAACGGDAELRARVEALLAAHEAAGDFLKLRGADPAADATVSFGERPGSHIGHYKLLAQIGEGGFAVVFMAEQEQPVRRRVALKIIKLGMDTRQIVARFEAERQALAMMDHPSIAKVFDAGATGPASGCPGRPYFVMELVKGMPITEYCDQHKLTIDQRLNLFAQVCSAVQHAHQKGVIHRDIKPSNVLVSTQDDRPAAKVIDFGIAKAIQAPLTEKTLFTDFRQLIGTPAYMSPEQADGSLDIDTRSDVYSLGVLLYELLAGTPPFDPKELRAKAFGEMQRIIREEEPPTPSTRLSGGHDTLPSIAALRAVEPRKLAAMLRGELDWIVMRCLEKDRARRYQTANALATDVMNYLADDPVSACPPSFGYKLKKFARKYRTPLVTAGAFAAILVAGTVVSIWQAVRATSALRAEAAQRERANANLSRAIDAVEEYLVGVTSDVRLNQADLQGLRRDLLASAVPFYQDFARQKQYDPDLEWNRGRALRGLSLLHLEMGQQDAAWRYFEQAHAVFEALATAHPQEWRYRQSLGAIYSDRGNLLRDTERWPEALEAYRKAFAVKEQVAEDFPTELELQVDLGIQHGNLGVSLLDRGQFDESQDEFRLATERLRAIVNGPSATPEARHTLGMSHTNLGLLLYMTGSAEAEAELLAAVRVLEPLIAENPQEPKYERILAAAYNHLGGHYRDSQQDEKSFDAYDKSLSIYSRLAERFPAVPSFVSEFGATQSNLAMLRLNQNNLADAEQLLHRAIECQQSALRTNPRNTFYHTNLSNHYAILMDVHVRKGEHAAAADFAAKLAAQRATNAEDAYDAGRGLAQCAALAKSDENLNETPRTELAAKYSGQAITFLRDAVKRGLTDLERFETDVGLEALRELPDFQKLTSELEAIPNRATPDSNN